MNIYYYDFKHRGRDASVDVHSRQEKVFKIAKDVITKLLYLTISMSNHYNFEHRRNEA